MDSLNTPRKNRGFVFLGSKASKNLLIGILLFCFLIGFIFMSGCSKQGVEIVKEVGGALIKREALIVVYLEDNISDDLKESMEKEIKSWEEVKEVKYISKEEALERFKEQNEGSDILKELQGNPLPASFEIKLKSGEKTERVVHNLMDENGNYIEGVNDIIYSEF